MTRPVRGDRTGEHGLALISVLWVTLLLSTMLGALLATTRVSLRLSDNLAKQAEAAAAAEAGINRAILGLMDADRTTRWQTDGQPREFEFAGRTVTVSVFDETGKIDLNRAPDALLDGLLTSVGLSTDDSARLVDAIADWRDEDNLRRLHGAEAAEYRAAGLDHTPRNAPFQVLGELRQVLGMSEPLFHCIAPALTLHSGRRAVNQRAAPPLVKKALGILEDGPSTPRGAGVVAMAGSLGGQAFTIRAEVPTPGMAPLVREAIVRITENSRQPYWILAWNKGGGAPSDTGAQCTEPGQSTE